MPELYPMNPTPPKTVRAFFSTLAGKLDPEAAEGLDAVYQFNLNGADGGQYQLQIRDGACQVSEGTHPDPHVTLAMSGVKIKAEKCTDLLKTVRNIQCESAIGKS